MQLLKYSGCELGHHPTEKMIDPLFLRANGVIFVDIDNKRDRKNSQIMLDKVLKKNDNIMIFPEGTWNLSENKIINNTHFGAVELALQNDAVIIPIAVEQYEKRFVINIGKIFDPDIVKQQYTNMKYSELIDDSEHARMKYYIKSNANRIMRDNLATLKYEIWEKEGITKRKTIPYDYWHEFIKERLAEWQGYSMSEQFRNGCFPKEIEEYNSMINEVSEMRISRRNAFLFMSTDSFIRNYSEL